MAAVCTAPAKGFTRQIGVGILGNHADTKTPTLVTGHNLACDLRRAHKVEDRVLQYPAIFGFSAVKQHFCKIAVIVQGRDKTRAAKVMGIRHVLKNAALGHRKDGIFAIPFGVHLDHSCLLLCRRDKGCINHSTWLENLLFQKGEIVGARHLLNDFGKDIKCGGATIHLHAARLKIQTVFDVIRNRGVKGQPVLTRHCGKLVKSAANSRCVSKDVFDGRHFFRGVGIARNLLDLYASKLGEVEVDPVIKRQKPPLHKYQCGNRGNRLCH